jgi:hypothetical protein
MTQPSIAPVNHFKLFQKPWTWWFMVAVLALVAAARLRLLNFPLERDEGEYAYAGQLILQGIPPYELAYNMKFPGTYLAYAAIMALFGQTPAGIHFGLLLLTTATALMLFWLGKKILDQTAGMVAATSYAVLAISTAMFGFAAHATHFCAFFVTAGLCLMWLARQNGGWITIIASGLSFGTAVLMKQHAAFITLWAAIAFTVINIKKTEIPFPKRLTAITMFGTELIFPSVLCCLILWWMGVFEKFWFWTVDYARAYVSIAPVSELLPQLWWSLRSIVSDCRLWWLAGAGLLVIWFDHRLRKIRIWLLGLVLASALATCPGFYFRTHYFLLTLPAMALLAGCTISGIAHILRQKTGTVKFSQWPAGVYVLVLVGTLIQYGNVCSVLARVGGHALYGGEPFPEAEKMAAFIRDNSSPNARIAVLGSEPEVYFLAHRRSATGYIYTYGLMEPQPFARRMQDEMIHEIEANTPEFIVFSSGNSSWQQRLGSDMKIFQWWNFYQTNYTLIGLADVISPVKIQYAWGVDASHYGKLKADGLELFHRNFVPSTE